MTRGLPSVVARVRATLGATASNSSPSADLRRAAQLVRVVAHAATAHANRLAWPAKRRAMADARALHALADVLAGPGAGPMAGGR